MKLEQLLATQGLVRLCPAADDIRRRAGLSSPLKVFYGETYDASGNTFDSMKYYLFVAALADALRQEGSVVNPVILVADSAACRNAPEEQEQRYLQLGELRAEFVRKVSEVYGADLHVIKMSEYISSPSFQQKLKEITVACQADPILMQQVEATVPPSKLDEERKKGFQYSFDEIATIIDLDIKVGPPREDLYDNIARELAQRRGTQPLLSLFLTPTFPLGMSWAYFFSQDGIEDHGITAYKGASKRLQNHRILVGRTDIEYARRLLDASFISLNPQLPNAVLDVGIICELAQKRLEHSESPITLADDFYAGRISIDQLRKKVGDDVERYILSKVP